MMTPVQRRARRIRRIRAKIRGTADRPRFAVRKSHTSLSAQLIDDSSGRTLLSGLVRGKTVVKGKELGALIAKAAKQKKISRAVFDRAGYRYHGAVKAVADTARLGGLVL